jgi:hypothetical protein
VKLLILREEVIYHGPEDQIDPATQDEDRK